MRALIYPSSDLAQPETLQIVRGAGVYLYDAQGRPYLDGMAGLWCCALGYGHQELIESIEQALQQLSYGHLFGGRGHPWAEPLAERLRAWVPIEQGWCFFGNSGSDANDTLLKIVRYRAAVTGQPWRRKVITRERAYHGVTLGAAALTSLPINLQHFDPPVEALGILRTEAPHYYRGHLPGESESTFVQRITDNLERLILAEGPETIAAFCAEPITGASGVIVPPPGYYARVREILDRYGIAFWADEVITGFGRTGEAFGCESMGIGRPAMMSLAKQLSSGYFPISAAVVSGEIYHDLQAAGEPGSIWGHGFTYSGHPVGCVAALKTLEILEREQLVERAARRGHYLQRRLLSLVGHPLVGEVRGRGLLAAVELTLPSASPAELAAVVAQAQRHCQQLGLLVRAVAGSALAICPPLVISTAELDELVDKLKQGLDLTLQGFSAF